MGDNNPRLSVVKITQGGSGGPWLCCHGYTSLDVPERHRVTRMHSEAAEFIVDDADAVGAVPGTRDRVDPERFKGTVINLLRDDEVYEHMRGQLCRTRQELETAVLARLPKLGDGIRLEIHPADRDVGEYLVVRPDTLTVAEIKALGEFDGF